MPPVLLLYLTCVASVVGCFGRVVSLFGLRRRKLAGCWTSARARSRQAEPVVSTGRLFRPAGWLGRTVSCGRALANELPADEPAGNASGVQLTRAPVDLQPRRKGGTGQTDGGASTRGTRREDPHSVAAAALACTPAFSRRKVDGAPRRTASAGRWQNARRCVRKALDGPGRRACRHQWRFGTSDFSTAVKGNTTRRQNP